MEKIVIVSAFFDIGRNDYTKMQRSNDKYFNNFEFWACIKNDLVVFCGSEEHKKRILDIREKYNLKDKTKVVIIEDITALIPEQYSKMEYISNDNYFKNIRVYKNILSNKPLYDLVNYLKLYFVNEAKKRFEIEEQLAWFDFGFNHGGAYYKNKDDFNFEWKYDCDNKAHFFYENKLDERPMFEIIRTVKPDPMLGAMFIVPSEHTEVIWNNFLSSINSMLDMGFIDDDQPLLLLTYRKCKDISVAMESRNCEQLKLCGASHMTYTFTEKKYKFLRKIKKYFEIRIRISKYHKFDRKILIDTYDE